MCRLYLFRLKVEDKIKNYAIISKSPNALLDSEQEDTISGNYSSIGMPNNFIIYKSVYDIDDFYFNFEDMTKSFTDDDTFRVFLTNSMYFLAINEHEFCLGPVTNGILNEQEYPNVIFLKDQEPEPETPVQTRAPRLNQQGTYRRGSRVSILSNNSSVDPIAE
jgi:hypothetical protein